MMAVNVKQLSEVEKINLSRCEAESDRQMGISRRQQALLAAAAEDGLARRWTIIKVEPRRENDVDNLLSRAMIEHWLPLRKADSTVGGRRRGQPGQAVECVLPAVNVEDVAGGKAVAHGRAPDGRCGAGVAHGAHWNAVRSSCAFDVKRD